MTGKKRSLPDDLFTLKGGQPARPRVGEDGFGFCSGDAAAAPGQRSSSTPFSPAPPSGPSSPPITVNKKIDRALKKLDRLKDKPGVEKERITIATDALKAAKDPKFARPRALLLFRRGVAYREHGERVGAQASFRQAIADFDAALEVQTRATDPAGWARTQGNRATALQAQGELAGDPDLLGEAVAGYDAALEVKTRASDPVGWAVTQMNRAIALRIQGELAGDPDLLAEAVAGFNSALEVRTRATNPTGWARTQVNRANVLVRQGALAGDPDLMRAAVAGYDAALTVMTRAKDPAGWAVNQVNRATALRNQGELAGDPDLLGEAVAGYDAALAVKSRASDPAGWATTQMNRAIVLAAQGALAGDPDLLAEAVAGYDAVLEVRTRTNDPAGWARTQVNRGSALLNQGELASDPELMRDAVAGYDAALQVMTRANDPAGWAVTQMNRANAFAAQGELTDDPDLLAEAVAGYDAALEFRTGATDPAGWAATQMNRANTLAAQGALAGDPDLLAEAVAGYGAALDVLRPETMPDQYMGTQSSLAHALFAIPSWRDLSHRLDEALKASDRILLGTNLSGPGREQAVDRASGLHGLRAWCALELEDETPDQALAFLEGGRARLLALALLDLDAAAGQLPTEELRTAYRARQGEIRRLRHRLVGSGTQDGMLAGDLDGPKAAPAQLDEAERKALEARLGALEKQQRELLGKHRLLPELKKPTAEQLLGRIPEGGAAVLPLVTEAGAKVFVLPHRAGQDRGDKRGTADSDNLVDEADILSLPELTEARIREWVHGPKGSGKGGGYLGAYSALQDAQGGKPGTSRAVAEAAFREALEGVLGVVWTDLLEPVEQRLAALEEAGRITHDGPVVVLPPGLLALLPLAAAGEAVNGQLVPWSSRRSISMVPSLETLDRRQKQGAGREEAPSSGPQADVREEAAPGEAAPEAATPLGLVGVIEPARPNDRGVNPLETSLNEQKMLAARFGPHNPVILAGAAATTGNLLVALEAQDEAASPYILHLSAHGLHEATRPEHSAVLLAEAGDPDRLTLAALQMQGAKTAQMRLVFLSACESGLNGIRRAAEEFIGLPAGFLQAGAGAVVASHWPVNEWAALLLSWKFYETYLDADGRVREEHDDTGRHTGGHTGRLRRVTPALALARAQAWLKDVTNRELETIPGVLDAAGGFSPTRMFLEAGQKAPPRILTRSGEGPDDDLGEAVSGSPRNRGAGQGKAKPGKAGPNEAGPGEAGPARMDLDADLHDPDAHDPDARPFADPIHWAAFSVMGR